jgi:hypothetical protein
MVDSMTYQQPQRNVASLLASSNLKRWIIVLFLFYKLDYKDYYCYGISSSSAILNNENGKDLVYFPPRRKLGFCRRRRCRVAKTLSPYFSSFFCFALSDSKVNLLSLLPRLPCFTFFLSSQLGSGALCSPQALRSFFFFALVFISEGGERLCWITK